MATRSSLSSQLRTIGYLSSVHLNLQRDWYSIAGQPAPALRLAHPEEYAALSIVLVIRPRVSRSCEHFPNGFDLHHFPDGFDLYLPRSSAPSATSLRYTRNPKKNETRNPEPETRTMGTDIPNHKTGAPNGRSSPLKPTSYRLCESDFFIDNLLVLIRLVVEMI